MSNGDAERKVFLRFSFSMKYIFMRQLSFIVLYVDCTNALNKTSVLQIRRGDRNSLHLSTKTYVETCHWNGLVS